MFWTCPRSRLAASELNPATFNLSRLLDDLAAMFRLRAEAKALRFEMLVDGESVPYVVADEGKIRQALINLLGNAIKFTKRGQIKLHVTLDQRSANQLWLSARVEDTGSGITDEDQRSCSSRLAKPSVVLTPRREPAWGWPSAANTRD